MILAGDIGGTHTRLALFSEQGELTLSSEQKFSSREFRGLEEIVQKFLAGRHILKACFGVAGPVRRQRCQATNLPWVIDAASLGRAFCAPVRLLNDLEANAYGLNALKSDELGLIQRGTPQAGNRALIAAGTGLGEAGLFWDGTTHHPFACEGGHTDFAPRNALEIDLFNHLHEEHDHVSYERVVSGPGLYALYQFLVDTGREQALPDTEAQMKLQDPSTVVSERGLARIDTACVRALEWFVSLYGAEAGNLALKFLALGGIYIGGGIAPRLVSLLKSEIFLTAFSQKGRFKALLESIPIHVILNDNTALLGAGWFARHAWPI